MLSRRFPWAALGLGLALMLAGNALAQGDRTTGQTVYVPLYSEVPHGDRGGKVLVRASVVVRNLDPSQPLTIRSVSYHHSDGRKLLDLIEKPVRLAPLASHSFEVGETDTSGGLAPSMQIRWEAERAVDPPIVEGLMISTFQGQGISFRTDGRVLTPPSASR